MTAVKKRKLKQKVQYEIRKVLFENGADDETLFLSLLYALDAINDETLFLSLLYALEAINIDLNSFNDIFE